MLLETRQIGLADEWRPLVPQGDHREAASAVLNTVLQSSLVWNDELHIIANEHFDTAPASSEHISNLNAAISRAVLEWIAQWPR
jgi:hypothetical protein